VASVLKFPGIYFFGIFLGKFWENSENKGKYANQSTLLEEIQGKFSDLMPRSNLCVLYFVSEKHCLENYLASCFGSPNGEAVLN
jgi:hypothetical protein